MNFNGLKNSLVKMFAWTYDDDTETDTLQNTSKKTNICFPLDCIVSKHVSRYLCEENYECTVNIQFIARSKNIMKKIPCSEKRYVSNLYIRLKNTKRLFFSKLFPHLKILKILFVGKTENYGMRRMRSRMNPQTTTYQILDKCMKEFSEALRKCANLSMLEIIGSESRGLKSFAKKSYFNVPQLKSLDLRNCSFSRDFVLTTFVNCFSNLESLNVYYCLGCKSLENPLLLKSLKKLRLHWKTFASGGLPEFGYKGKFNNQSIFKISKDLEELKINYNCCNFSPKMLKNFPKLKVLHNDGCKNLDYSFVGESLEELKLLGLSSEPETDFSHFKKLKKLFITFCGKLKRLSDDNLMIYKTVEYFGSRGGDSGVNDEIISKFEKLKTLSLVYNEQVTCECLQNLKILEELIVNQPRELTTKIKESPKFLRRVFFNYVSGLSGEHLKQFRRVKTMSIEGCELRKNSLLCLEEIEHLRIIRCRGNVMWKEVMDLKCLKSLEVDKCGINNIQIPVIVVKDLEKRGVELKWVGKSK